MGAGVVILVCLLLSAFFICLFFFFQEFFYFSEIATLYVVWCSFERLVQLCKEAHVCGCFVLDLEDLLAHIL